MKQTRKGAAGALYTAGIHIYQGLLRLASLRHPKAKAMLRGRRVALSTLRTAISPEDSPVWVHAASLGEFEQGRPLMERLRREHPDVKIVLSFYSPSGYKVRRDWAGADCVVYLPADTPRQMRRFLDAVHPRMAIFVKYEFWGNCLHELVRRGIQTYLISAVFRPSQVFFRRHGGYFRRLLDCFDHIYVQDPGSLKLLESRGVANVSVAGDTRFDRVTDIMRSTVEISELDSFTRGHTRFTFMAGSSWEGDEEMYFPWLKTMGERVRSVIAPHEFDTSRLRRMKERLAPEVKTVLLSEVRDNPALATTADCLIIDCFGLLSSAYRYATVAYVGGGFGAGLHNINEAAVYGIPVLYGPNNNKFIEAQELQLAGGGFCIHSRKELETLMDSLFANTTRRDKAGAAAATYIAAKIGATDTIYKALPL